MSIQKYLKTFLAEANVDQGVVDELKISIENDRKLYDQKIIPIVKNLQKKIKSGKYDHKLAPKLWMGLVELGAKEYQKQYGSDDIKWSDAFPKAVRMAVAQEFADEYKAELDAQGGVMFEDEQLDEKKELSAKQKELDVDGDGDIEGDDLAALRSKKKKKKVEESEDEMDDDEKDDGEEKVEEGELPPALKKAIEKKKGKKSDKEDDDKKDDDKKVEEGELPPALKKAIEKKKKKGGDSDEDDDKKSDDKKDDDKEDDTKKEDWEFDAEALVEATVVLPSDNSLIALMALSKKPNTMLTSKIKKELEGKGLVEGGKITKSGKDLLSTPEAKEKIEEIGS